MDQEKKFINNKQELFDAVVKQYRKELSKYVEVSENKSYFKFRIPFGFDVINGNEIIFDALEVKLNGEEDVTELDFLDVTVTLKEGSKVFWEKLTEDMINDVAKALVDQHINELIELESDSEGLKYLNNGKS